MLAARMLAFSSKALFDGLFRTDFLPREMSADTLGFNVLKLYCMEY
jgi:hypothetical protein